MQKKPENIKYNPKYLEPAALEEFAHHIWVTGTPLEKADANVSPFLECPSLNEQQSPGPLSWLRLARTSLLLSTGMIADRLGISRAAYARIEKSEETGAVTLATLRRAADALNCEVVFAIRPKKKVKFSKIIWNSLKSEAVKIVERRPHQKTMKPFVWAQITKDLLKDPKTRRKNNWSIRTGLS